MIDGLAVGAHTASALTRVTAPRADARTSGRTVRVRQTLGPASRVRVPVEAGFAFTRGTRSSHATNSAGSTWRWIARIR